MKRQICSTNPQPSNLFLSNLFPQPLDTHCQLSNNNFLLGVSESALQNVAYSGSSTEAEGWRLDSNVKEKKENTAENVYSQYLPFQTAQKSKALQDNPTFGKKMQKSPLNTMQNM